MKYEPPSPITITTTRPHGLAAGDFVTIDLRQRPRFMPKWFYRLVWRRWFQPPPTMHRVLNVDVTTFTYDDETASK